MQTQRYTYQKLFIESNLLLLRGTVRTDDGDAITATETMMCPSVALFPMKMSFLLVAVEASIFHREVKEEIALPIVIHVRDVTLVNRPSAAAVFDDLMSAEPIVHVLARRVELLGLKNCDRDDAVAVRIGCSSRSPV